MTLFTGSEPHDISLDEAAEMTKNYRDAARAHTTGEVVKGHYFGNSRISEIMAQEECVGIRIYYGLNEDGVQQLVVCGVKADGNDLYEGLLAERSYNCPPRCSLANPLNSDV